MIPAKNIPSLDKRLNRVIIMPWVKGELREDIEREAWPCGLLVLKDEHQYVAVDW